MNGKQIDWASIRSQIETGAAIDHAAAIQPERKLDILRSRARALALEHQTAPTTPPLQIVEFVLTSEKYAVEAVAIREVLPLKDLTPLPGTPALIAGIINVRGEILSIVDLRRLFGVDATSEPQRVVVIHNAGMEFGILADAVIGTRFIGLGDIQPPVAVLNNARKQYVRGITEDSTIILDAEKLLSDPRLIVDEEVQA